MIYSSRVKRKDKNTLIQDGEKEIEKTALIRAG